MMLPRWISGKMRNSLMVCVCKSLRPSVALGARSVAMVAWQCEGVRMYGEHRGERRGKGGEDTPIQMRIEKSCCEKVRHGGMPPEKVYDAKLSCCGPIKLSIFRSFPGHDDEAVWTITKCHRKPVPN